jgi:hypothetical protein
MFIFKWSWVALIFIAVLIGTGCTTVHNDQRTCTTDCNIGSSQPVYAPAPVVVMQPGYRRYYRHGPAVIYHW